MIHSTAGGLRYDHITKQFYMPCVFCGGRHNGNTQATAMRAKDECHERWFRKQVANTIKEKEEK